jgi:thiol-disulfide isomerase/thioredoxin
MIKPFNNQKVTSILLALKPWALAVAFILIFRFTGILSGMSFLAQSALLKTGLMDFNPTETSTTEEPFDYNMTLKDLKGNPLNVNQLKGKVIFLNLWATWCGPCRVEMPSIQNLYNKVDHEKIIFIMLSLDAPESQTKVGKYVKEKDFTFPVYLPSGLLPSQLDVPSIPTTFIIGRDGKIKSKKVGVSNYDTDKFKKFIEGLTIR